MKLNATLHIELNGKTIVQEAMTFHPISAMTAQNITSSILEPFKKHQAQKASFELYNEIKKEFENQKSDSPV